MLYRHTSLKLRSGRCKWAQKLEFHYVCQSHLIGEHITLCGPFFFSIHITFKHIRLFLFYLFSRWSSMIVGENQRSFNFLISYLILAVNSSSVYYCLWEKALVFVSSNLGLQIEKKGFCICPNDIFLFMTYLFCLHSYFMGLTLILCSISYDSLI